MLLLYVGSVCELLKKQLKDAAEHTKQITDAEEGGSEGHSKRQLIHLPIVHEADVSPPGPLNACPVSRIPSAVAPGS